MRLMHTHFENERWTLVFRHSSTDIISVTYRSGKLGLVPTFSVSEVVEATITFLEENDSDLYRRKVLTEKINKKDILISGLIVKGKVIT